MLLVNFSRLSVSHWIQLFGFRMIEPENVPTVSNDSLSLGERYYFKDFFSVNGLILYTTQVFGCNLLTPPTNWFSFFCFHYELPLISTTAG